MVARPYTMLDSGGGGMFSSAAGLLSIFGAINAGIGTYFGLESQKIAGKSQESSLRHQADIADINAGIAENQAIAIEEAGSKELARFGLQVGADKSRRIAAQAASGTQLTGGSAVEARASAALIAEIDRLNIEGNIVRQAEAARTQGVNIRNDALLTRASADNVRASHESISPLTGLSTSLLSSAGTLAREWRFAQRDDYRRSR